MFFPIINSTISFCLTLVYLVLSTSRHCHRRSHSLPLPFVRSLSHARLIFHIQIYPLAHVPPSSLLQECHNNCLLILFWLKRTHVRHRLSSRSLLWLLWSSLAWLIGTGQCLQTSLQTTSSTTRTLTTAGFTSGSSLQCFCCKQAFWSATLVAWKSWLQYPSIGGLWYVTMSVSPAGVRAHGVKRILR